MGVNENETGRGICGWAGIKNGGKILGYLKNTDDLGIIYRWVAPREEETEFLGPQGMGALKIQADVSFAPGEIYPGRHGPVWRNHCLGVDQAGLYDIINSGSRADRLCAGDSDRRGGVDTGGTAGRIQGQEDDSGRQRGGHQHHHYTNVRMAVKAPEMSGWEVGRAHRRRGVGVEAFARDASGGGWVDQTTGKDPVREVPRRNAPGSDRGEEDQEGAGQEGHGDGRSSRVADGGQVKGSDRHVELGDIEVVEMNQLRGQRSCEERAAAAGKVELGKPEDENKA